MGLDERHGRPAARGTRLVPALPRRDAALKPADTGVVLGRWAIAAIAATFLLMGLVVSAYGPLLALLTIRFGVSLPAAGSIISVHFGGGLLGVLVAMRTLSMRPGRDTFMGALAIGSAGCVAAALAPSWPMFLGAIAIIGFGYGALVIGLNQLVAYSENKRRTALLNGLNGAYSAGAVMGPIIVVTLATGRLPLLFSLAAVAGFALVLPAAGVSGRLPVTAAAPGRPGLLVGIFVVAFIFYVAIEVGAGGWMPSHLVSTGLSRTAAATATSGFFLALVTGRLLSALIPTSVPERVVVLSGAAVATGALMAASVPAIAPAAYILAGLAMAPIFPTGIAWLAKLRPGDARATSWLYPAATIGGVTGPGLIGIVIAGFGIRWAPAVLAGVAVLMTASFYLARRSAA